MLLSCRSCVSVIELCETALAWEEVRLDTMLELQRGHTPSTHRRHSPSKIHHSSSVRIVALSISLQGQSYPVVVAQRSMYWALLSPSSRGQSTTYAVRLSTDRKLSSPGRVADLDPDVGGRSRRGA